MLPDTMQYATRHNAVLRDHVVTHPNNATCMFPTILNELPDLAGNHILKSIVMDCNKADCFTVIGGGGGGGGARCSFVVRAFAMVRWVVGSILHGMDPLSYFSFQSVLHDWCNKGCGMCYPVCGMVHIK